MNERDGRSRSLILARIAKDGVKNYFISHVTILHRKPHTLKNYNRIENETENSKNDNH